jgi:hypothetical protein
MDGDFVDDIVLAIRGLKARQIILASQYIDQVSQLAALQKHTKSQWEVPRM